MSTFEKLSKVDVNQFKETKGRFAYLSWADAVSEMLKVAPDATWEVVKDVNGYPFTQTPCGTFVEVRLTIDGITRSQVHPVLNHSNKPIPTPNAFEINTSIQRCLAKVIALHGLGLYIYRGEDLPPAPKAEIDNTKLPNEKHVQAAYVSWKAIIDADVDVMDYQKLQEEYAKLSNDELMAVANLFGSDKPEGSKKGYKAIVKELKSMTAADLQNPSDYQETGENP